MYCDLELEATWDYKDKYLGVGCLGLKTTRRIEKEEKNQRMFACFHVFLE